MNAVAHSTTGRDLRVLTLVSTGHFMSHYSQMILPPLFPLMASDYGVGYAALGLVVTLINASGAFVQIPVGFLVDRIGAKKILIVGLLIKTGALGAMALTTSYDMLLVLALLAGVGHAVFHPADYAILMSSIDERRMGRAFSIHTASGNAGSAVAPMLIVLIATLWDWRAALFSVAIMGAVTSAAMMLQAGVMADHTGTKQKGRERNRARRAGDLIDEVRLLLKPAVLILYFFFFVTALITVGINSFTVTALAQAHGTSLAAGGAALTAYLSAGFCGILLGGLLADRTSRHDLIAAAAFVLSAVVMTAVGYFELSLPALIVAYGVIGILLGLVRPARDMMVKSVTRKRDAGKTFGFMSNGHFVGGAVVPVLLGWVIDKGAARWVFWLAAIFMIAALLTLFAPKGAERDTDKAI